MSTSFSRSIRTLQTETSGGSTGLLLLVVLLLAAWLAWAVLAQVPMYAMAETAELTSNTQAVAHFPPDALLRIQPGQSGLLRLDDFPWGEYGTVQVSVVEVGEELQDGRFQVELRLEPEADSLIPLQSGLTGSVEIEVEQLSPITILLRTTGQRVAGSSKTTP